MENPTLARWLRRLARWFDPPGRTLGKDGQPTAAVFETPSGQVHLAQDPVDNDSLQLIVSEYGRVPVSIVLTTPELAALFMGVGRWLGLELYTPGGAVWPTPPTPRNLPLKMRG